MRSEHALRQQLIDTSPGHLNVLAYRGKLHLPNAARKLGTPGPVISIPELSARTRNSPMLGGAK